MTSTVNTIPPSGSIYSINSKARQYLSEPPLNFTANFVNGDIRTLGPGSYKFTVKEVIFENLIPNISKYNNVFQVRYNGALNTTVFNPGNYNINSFMDALDSFLLAIDSNLTANYDVTTGLLSINIPNGSTLIFPREPPLNPFIEENSYLYPGGPLDRFLDLIGFEPQTFCNRAFVGPVTIKGVSPVNLYGTTFIDVNVNANLGGVHMTNSNLQHLIRIPIDVPYGQVKAYNPTNPNCFNIDSDAIAALRYTITDSWGQPVDTVPNNTGFAMTALIIPNNKF